MSKTVVIVGGSALANELAKGLGVLSHSVTQIQKSVISQKAAQSNSQKNSSSGPETENGSASKNNTSKSDASKSGILENNDFPSDHVDILVWVQDVAGDPTPVLEQSENDWISNCDNEIKSALDTTAKFHPLMKSGGVMILVVPTISMSGAQGFAASAGAGGAVHVLGKGLARLFGGSISGTTSIQVHTLALHPAHFISDRKTADKLNSAMSLGAPAFDGIGDPKTDIAKIVNMLASDDARFLTGSTLSADGGMWMA